MTLKIILFACGIGLGIILWSVFVPPPKTVFVPVTNDSLKAVVDSQNIIITLLQIDIITSKTKEQKYLSERNEYAKKISLYSKSDVIAWLDSVESRYMLP